MSKAIRHGCQQLLHTRDTLRETFVGSVDIGGLFPASTVASDTVDLPVLLLIGILDVLRAIREQHRERTRHGLDWLILVQVGFCLDFSNRFAVEYLLALVVRLILRSLVNHALCPIFFLLIIWPSSAFTTCSVSFFFV